MCIFFFFFNFFPQSDVVEIIWKWASLYCITSLNEKEYVRSEKKQENLKTAKLVVAHSTSRTLSNM